MDPIEGGGFKDTPPILRVCDVRLDSNFFTSYDNSKIDKVIKLKFNMIVNLQGSEMVTLSEIIYLIIVIMITVIIVKW